MFIAYNDQYNFSFGEMNPLILMNAHEVKPVLLLCAGPEEFYFSISEGSVQPLIPHIAHTVQSKLGISLL